MSSAGVRNRARTDAAGGTIGPSSTACRFVNGRHAGRRSAFNS